MGTSLHVCVFHPDPVGSAGEKHVMSAQPVGHGQTRNPTADTTADTPQGRGKASPFCRVPRMWPNPYFRANT